jgi:hypothetical protein
MPCCLTDQSTILDPLSRAWLLADISISPEFQQRSSPWLNGFTCGSRLLEGFLTFSPSIHAMINGVPQFLRG